jgi:hypothetical protein
MCYQSASESPGQRTSHGGSGGRTTLRNFSSDTIGHNDHVVTTRAELEQLGFEGFVRFQDLPDTDVPTAAGVYAVLRAGSDQPVTFLTTSPAGIIGGRDPSVSLDTLAEAWVNEVEVLYFGKASGSGGGLRRRLGTYRRHGAGRPSRHWGGRYIWQLGDADQLLVAWKLTPSEKPEIAEACLIRQFVVATGQRPFANRNLGRATPLRASTAGNDVVPTCAD